MVQKVIRMRRPVSGGHYYKTVFIFYCLQIPAMFFICATTLAWGGWQMSFRRVSEAISATVPVIGIICGVILLAICFGNNHELYHWTDSNLVKDDAALQWKSGFLNKTFFTGGPSSLLPPGR
jgi:hypothetical protein